MDDYISREILLHEIRGQHPDDDLHYPSWYEGMVKRQPAADVVARDCYNAILWENDIMRKQLADVSKKFGEKMDDVHKVVYCKDCDSWNEDRSCSYWSGEASIVYTLPYEYCSNGYPVEEE